jgi:oxygen-independent coproporphyrinogen-3 oxidase
LTGLRAAGITRLSVGVQSFDDARLTDLGRSHRAAEARTVLRQASRLGFPNVGADLLYGLPDLEIGDLRDWVRELADLEMTHISAYCLEVHPGTPLASSVACGQIRPAVASEEVAQWEALVSATEAAGYRIYEISNFARAGFQCRHNLAYWSGHPYLGLGPGAHGFAPDAGDWGTRAWNGTGLASYVSRLQQGLLPSGGAERLSREQALLERLFLGLRRPEPIDAEMFCRDLLVDRRAFGRAFERLRIHGFVDEGPGGVYTPRLEGMRRADGLAVWAHGQIEQPPAAGPA